MLQPLWFLYPEDQATFAIETQFFYGDAVLVSPVVEEGSTSVEVCLPNDVFYDWSTLRPLRGDASTVSIREFDYTTIPLHIRSGTIISLRVKSANTTRELRKKGFEILVAPGLDGDASRVLYLDDEESLVQNGTSEIGFRWICGNRTLLKDGMFEFDAGEVRIEKVKILGVERQPKSVMSNLGGRGREFEFVYHRTSTTLIVTSEWPLRRSAEMVIR